MHPEETGRGWKTVTALGDPAAAPSYAASSALAAVAVIAGVSVAGAKTTVRVYSVENRRDPVLLGRGRQDGLRPPASAAT